MVGPKRTAATFLAAALLLGTGACARGGADGTTEAGAGAAELVRAAGSTTASATTGRFEGTIEVTQVGEGLPLGGDGSMRGVESGAFDRAAGRTRTRTEITDVDGGSPDGSSAAGRPTAGQIQEVIVDGATIYLEMPGTSLVPGDPDTPWIALPDGSRRQGLSALGNGLSAEGMFASLASTTAAVDDLGHEDVRGADTRHLRVQTDINGLWAASTGTTAPATPCARNGQAPVGVDVWIGADRLVRRMRWTYDLAAALTPGDGCTDPGPGSGRPSGFATSLTSVETVEFFGFGEPVTIDLPPADQIASFGGIGGFTPSGTAVHRPSDDAASETTLPAVVPSAP